MWDFLVIALEKKPEGIRRSDLSTVWIFEELKLVPV